MWLVIVLLLYIAFELSRAREKAAGRKYASLLAGAEVAGVLIGVALLHKFWA
jgi:hypothetical protein